MPLFPGAAQRTAWNKKALRMKPEARRSVSAAALKNNRSDFLVERLRSFTRESHSCVIFVIFTTATQCPSELRSRTGVFFFFPPFFSYCESIFTVDSLLVKKNAMRCFLHSWPVFQSYILRGTTTLRVVWHEDTHGGCLNRRSDWAVMSHEQTRKQTSFLNH